MIGLCITPTHAIIILAERQSIKASEPFSVPNESTESSKVLSPTLIKHADVIFDILSLQSAGKSSSYIICSVKMEVTL